ncbi:MAG TPA: hypothetical protein VHU83_07995 [Bryobacteraceae bacterium]|jgi:hypothetical protein|nr:hypothetical protein [Bryobacteraceae bacterium]
MYLGTQFTGTLAPNQSINYYTFGWSTAWDVLWQMMPTSTGGAAQIGWTVSTQLSGTSITYWILVTNLSSATIDFEGRYAILNL